MPLIFLLALNEEENELEEEQRGKRENCRNPRLFLLKSMGNEENILRLKKGMECSRSEISKVYENLKEEDP